MSSGRQKMWIKFELTLLDMVVFRDAKSGRAREQCSREAPEKYCVLREVLVATNISSIFMTKLTVYAKGLTGSHRTINICLR